MNMNTEQDVWMEAFRRTRPTPTSSLEPAKKNLFYVGENLSLVANLAKAYDMGYATSVSLPQAMSYLRQLAKEGYRFSGFLLETPLHIPQIKSFIVYLSDTPYGSIPVLYVSSYLKGTEIKELSSLRLMDDIVHPIKDLFTIGERIIFLEKVKQGQSLKGASGRLYAGTIIGMLAASVKRMADITASLLLLLFLSPVMLMIAVWIKFDSRGPVFHNSYRAGRGYRLFKLYRFRTGKVGAARLLSSLSVSRNFLHHGTSFIKASHRSGLTRAGNLLQKTGLESIPQLLNVLKGDISIVGNRPLPLSEASLLTSDQLAIRFNVQAGMTGPWHPAQGIREDNLRLRLELEYASDWSLVKDIRILSRIPFMLWKKHTGFYRNGL